MAEQGDEWPVPLVGVTESLVTTLGPNDRWNVAPLGIHEPGKEETHPTARTWGRTRTWRNFSERKESYVQYLRDPVLYVDAALDIREVDEPVLDGANWWVEIRPEAIDQGTDGETEWVEWRLVPVDSAVEARTAPTYNRGYAAVVEATVAASRLNVDAYDDDALWDRISYFEAVADRCGGSRVQEAFERLLELIEE